MRQRTTSCTPGARCGLKPGVPSDVSGSKSVKVARVARVVLPAQINVSVMEL